MTLQPEEKKIAFCEALFREACNEAKKRLGSLTKSEQIQMSDLLKAFRNLKLETYSAQFGHINTEWNEALAIIGEYTSAHQHKELPHLPQEIGEAMGHALLSWTHFNKLSEEMKGHIKKTHSSFLTQKEKMLEHITHFFAELKIRTSSLSPSEKQSIIALLSVFEAQTKELEKKGAAHDIKATLERLVGEFNKLSQNKNPSRNLQSFIVKATHDLTHFKTMNF